MMRSSDFPVPRIKTYCHCCGERQAFVCREVSTTSHVSDFQQTFSFVYECQGQCKGTKVVFLVHRNGGKVTLTGRDPFETIEVPKSIESIAGKAVSKHFSAALVAYNAGQILPAIFMLRVFVEQFWRSIDKVAETVREKEKPSGDELGEAYNATLQDWFKQQFPSLPAQYQALSGAIHEARVDPKLFEGCREGIESHFEALAGVRRTRK